MKKILIITIVMMLLTSCADKNVVVVPMPTASPTAVATPAPTPLSEQYDDLNVQYIRLNSYEDDGQAIKSIVLQSTADVYNYYEQNKFDYNLIDGISYENDFNRIGFADAISKYSDEYFQDSDLLILEVTESSGSITHNVTSAVATDGETTIHLQRLVPYEGTDDMASWIILIKLPKHAVDGKEILIEIEEVSSDKQLEEIDTYFAISSGAATIEAYNHLTYSRVYAEENGKKKSAKDDIPKIEDIADGLPELAIESNFLVSYPNVTVRKMTIYDEKFKVHETSKNLMLEQVILYDPGTYYVDVEYVYTGKYIENARENNYFRGNFYIKLIVPDRQYGLAKSLEESCKIDFSKMESAELFVQYDGMKDAISIDDGGAWKLLTYLRASAVVPKESNVSLSDISRKIVLYSEGEETAVIMSTFNGIYVESAGQGYYLDVPPWCFELMVKSIAGNVIIPLNDAIFIAKDAISEMNYIKLWEDINCKTTTELIRDIEGYKWQITFSLANENGKGEQVSSVTIVGQGIILEVKGDKN